MQPVQVTPSMTPMEKVYAVLLFAILGAWALWLTLVTYRLLSQPQ